jgi:GDP-L-fucose synthase
MKILVTGGTGLVGKALEKVTTVTHRQEQFIFWGSRDCNLLDSKETMLRFSELQPDVVIHLAAKVGGLYDNMTNQRDFLRDNTLLSFNVFDAAVAHRVKKVICCLSTCIFPDGIPLPMRETDLHNGPPHNSNFGYAHAKRLVEVMCRAYSGDTLFVPIVPTNVFGEHDNFHLEKAHVIPALIHKCYLAKKTGTPLHVSGDGSALRQFIWSRDLANLILRVMDTYHSNEPIILADEAEYSIRDVVTQIAECLDFQGDVIFCKDMPNGQHRKTVDTTKLKEHFPDFVFANLKSALQETVHWFVNAAECDLRI